MSDAPIVIVGTGMAGYTLAKEFRKLDKETALMLVTLDDGANYSKPMLSNGLAKDKSAQALAMQSAEQMATMVNADIRCNTCIEAIDPAARSLTFSDGESLAYDRLVLATGANQLQLPIGGSGAADTISVNNLQEYAVFRDRLAQGVKHVAIMGPGLIGCEFANDLATAEIRSTLIGPDAYPLQQLLPQSAGEAVQRALTGIGTEWRLGKVVEQIEKDEAGYQLTLSDGETIEADLVLSAAGLRPNIGLAQAAGLTTARGICVDTLLRTSDANIYALGDCAEVEGLVLPYVMPLMNCARALAKTLAGTETPVTYPAMPVAVKTPALPLSVSAPKVGAEGEWHTEALGENDLKVLFKSPEGELLGFVLTGSATAEKQALAKQLPPVLS